MIIPARMTPKLSHNELVEISTHFLKFLGCAYVATEYSIDVPGTKVLYEDRPTTKIVDVYGVPPIGGPFAVECGDTNLEQEKKLWKLLRCWEIRRLFLWPYKLPYLIEVTASTANHKKLAHASSQDTIDYLTGWSLAPTIGWTPRTTGDFAETEIPAPSIRAQQQHKHKPTIGPRFGKDSAYMMGANNTPKYVGPITRRGRRNTISNVIDKSEVLRLRTEGHSFQVIADRYDVSRQHIHQLVAKARRLGSG